MFHLHAKISKFADQICEAKTCQKWQQQQLKQKGERDIFGFVYKMDDDFCVPRQQIETHLKKKNINNIYHLVFDVNGSVLFGRSVFLLN